VVALIASLHLPGDKSISHRALLLAALCEGETRINGLLVAEDVRATYNALRALGVECSPFAPDVTVRGGGPSALRSPVDVVDCGNSGTTARLLAGMVAGCPSVSVTLTGDASLSRRPMQRVADPLRAMGAELSLSARGTLPMHIRGAALRETSHVLPVASAQVKSALLLAGVASGCAVTVQEPLPSRDHTERMLRALGIPISESRTDAQISTHMGAVGAVQARNVTVPGDSSAAAVFAALAVLSMNGEIVLQAVGLNPTRLGWVRLLQQMGAHVEVCHSKLAPDGIGEPVGAVRARSSRLRGITIGANVIPETIDELVLLACVAACAEGQTVIAGAAELRVKESDRIHLTVRNLRAVGVHAEERADGMVIEGTHASLRGVVHTEDDHRQAMAFGMLGVRHGNAITVDNPDCVRVSYPTYWDDLRRVSASFPAAQSTLSS
jgi:3-phosphoshikimate 1-carboxyvinyltransferase